MHLYLCNLLACYRYGLLEEYAGHVYLEIAAIFAVANQIGGRKNMGPCFFWARACGPSIGEQQIRFESNEALPQYDSVLCDNANIMCSMAIQSNLADAKRDTPRTLIGQRCSKGCMQFDISRSILRCGLKHWDIKQPVRRSTPHIFILLTHNAILLSEP